MTQYLITEPLRPIPCRCGAWTLAGHTGGLYVRVDPIPLDTRGELAALLDGRLTFDAHTQAHQSAIYLEWRDAERIAGDRTHPVLTEHRCGRIIGQLTHPPAPPAAPTQPDPAHPPF